MSYADQSNAGRAPSPSERPATAGAKAPLIATGRAVGDQVVSGVARFVSGVRDLDALRPDEILLARSIASDWRPLIRAAAAIVTNDDDPASQAAAIAGELGVPAVVGTVDGASPLWNGALLTVSCADGETGRVYEAGRRP